MDRDKYWNFMISRLLDVLASRIQRRRRRSAHEHGPAELEIQRQPRDVLSVNVQVAEVAFQAHGPVDRVGACGAEQLVRDGDGLADGMGYGQPGCAWKALAGPRRRSPAHPTSW